MLLRLTLVIPLAIGTLISNATADRPNIVIIIADDMGWNDVGFHGSEIPTPNIDALGYNGIILNRHYTWTSCSPSRASFLTGKYPSNLGVQGRPFMAGTTTALSLNEKIMPQYFKDLGYSTHLVGKWHLGYYNPKFLPTNRGFDTFFGYHGGSIGYYDGVHKYNGISGIDVWRNTEKAWQEFYGKYSSTRIADEAINTVKRHAENTTLNGLFLIVASPAPHLGNKPFHLEPPPFTHGEKTRNITNRDRRIYADVMKGLDDTVGRVTAALKQYGLIDNTIIVFFSDNGAATLGNNWHFKNHGSNWPLRGQKLSAHEGGVRTVAAVWASSIIKSRLSLDHDGLFHISDWLPTLYAAAGGKLEKLKNVDGMNQWDVLTSDGEIKNKREEMLVILEDETNLEALIKDKWKIVRNYQPYADVYFADAWLGENPSGILEYNKTEIINCLVAQSLPGQHLEENEIDKLRSKAILLDNCSNDLKNLSRLEDCATKYCLFDIFADPQECNNVASSNQNVVDELSNLLEGYKRKLIKKPANHGKLHEKGKPGISNYWEPWEFEDTLSNYVSVNIVIASILTLLILISVRGV